MRSLLIRLYPAGWRARYGGEFSAVLEERPLGPFDVADIVLGALDARLRLRGAFSGQAEREITMSLRIGGIAAILGSGLLTAGILLGSGLVPRADPVGAFALLIAGSIALFVAVAGLSAFQARTHPVTAWVAFLLPGLGFIVMLAGLIGLTFLQGSRIWWDVDPWGLMISGTFAAIAGSALFAYVTHRTGALSRSASLLLGAGSVGLVAMMTGTGGFLPVVLLPIVGGIGVIGFMVGWFVLGVQAIRIDASVIVTRPT